MKLFQTIGAILNAWTASVAAAIIAGFDRLVSPRVVRLIEDDKGGFTVEAAAKPDNVPARIAFAAGRCRRRGGDAFRLQSLSDDDYRGVRQRTAQHGGGRNPASRRR